MFGLVAVASMFFCLTFHGSLISQAVHKHCPQLRAENIFHRIVYLLNPLILSFNFYQLGIFFDHFRRTTIHPAYEQYMSGCHMISLLTNLEVQLFNTDGVVQLRYASYDLPTLIERLKQRKLVHILQQPFVNEHVYVFHDAIQLEFLAAGVWNGAEQRGAIVVGPCISKAYHPQLLREMSQKERLSLVMQRQLHQGYNTLTMVDKELSVAALPPLVKEAVTSIRFNVDQPLSLNRIANTLGVHPSYLSRTFKSALGMTLTNYINKLRIEEAKYVLDHGNVSVTQAALSVGYSDPNYFSRCLRSWSM
jgi:AraC-like DNA-binding protein